MSKKFTMLLASLFLTIGAAWAQTFVTPETGGYYKIKGLHSTNPWLAGVVENGGIDVVGAEGAAAVYLKTANGGLQVMATGKYMGIGGNGSQISLIDTESTVTLEDAGDNMFYIKVGGKYLHNSQPDYTREGTRDATSQNKFGFVEVVVDNNLVD